MSKRLKVVSSCCLLSLPDLPWVALRLGGGQVYPSDFRTSFSGLKSRRLGNGSRVGGGWRTVGHGLVEASSWETHVELEPEIIPGEGQKREHFF